MELFERSRLMERIVARGGTLDYQNRILASLFYRPSTRTRFCFEAAIQRLGGGVLSTEHPRAFSSEVEGEQGEHSIRIIGAYCDAIVIRHHEAGGASRVKIFFVSPPHMQMKSDILQYLDRHGVYYQLEPEIDKAVSEVDVVYRTRIRPERAIPAAKPLSYAIDSSVLQRLRQDAMILHPLPRTVELDKTVDDDPRAMYFRQAANGLFVTHGVAEHAAGWGIVCTGQKSVLHHGEHRDHEERLKAKSQELRSQ